MLINQREFTLFEPLAQSLAYDPDKNYLFDLSYLCGLSVTGENSNAFLQGQLTCDMREVNQKQMQSGALCNLKGRVLALLDVVDWHGLRLIMPLDLLEDTLTSLCKAALFSKVKLDPAVGFKCFGFKLQNVQDIMPQNLEFPLPINGVAHTDTICCYHLGVGNYICLVKDDAVSAFCAPFIQAKQWRGSLAWHALQLSAGRVEIYPQSRGLFLPHRLGLQHTGYLSFNKGCYKGQEIIARTHYLAKLKHESKLFLVQKIDDLQSGQIVLHPETQAKLGEVIDFCPIGESELLIKLSLVTEHPNMVLIGCTTISLESTYF